MELNPQGYKNWLLDFDDTLVSGWTTWGINSAFPNLVEEHNLESDTDQLSDAILLAQQQAPNDPDAVSLLTMLFETMQWPQELIEPFLVKMSTQYQPTLFDDSLRFLEALKAHHCRIFAITNNRRAVKIAEKLQIATYFDAIVTPVTSDTCTPKPEPGMWDYLRSQVQDLNPTETIMLGDDPWSDADFAKKCALPCIILDRLGRYPDLKYGVRVASLGDALSYSQEIRT